MKEASDLQQLGPVIKEQQKIIDSSIEKKIQLSKIQASLVQKQFEGGESNAHLSIDDKEMLNSLLNKNKEDGGSEKYKM